MITDGTMSKTYPSVTLSTTKPEQNPGLRVRSLIALPLPSKAIRLGAVMYVL
jgi:hypothetical protein